MKSGSTAKRATGDDKPLHPPRAVARLTGLSPHVLRAWENRYGAVVPARTAKGARRYTHSQVERLSRLADATRSGHSIGTVATLSDAELERLVTAERIGTSDVVTMLLAAATRLDQRQLARGLALQLATLGPRAFARNVARPLLVGVGDLWEGGAATIAAEHLVTREVRSMLETAIRPSSAEASRVDILLATPVGERHDLGLWIAAAGFQELGVGALILGSDLPADEIAAAQRMTRAAAVAISLVCLDSPSARPEVATLRSLVRAEVPIWIGGAGAVSLEIPGVVALSSLEDLDQHVRLLTLTEGKGSP